MGPPEKQRTVILYLDAFNKLDAVKEDSSSPTWLKSKKRWWGFQSKWEREQKCRADKNSCTCHIMPLKNLPKLSIGSSRNTEVDGKLEETWHYTFKYANDRTFFSCLRHGKHKKMLPWRDRSYHMHVRRIPLEGWSTENGLMACRWMLSKHRTTVNTVESVRQYWNLQNPSKLVRKS